MSGGERQRVAYARAISTDPETLVLECIQRVSQLSPTAIGIAKKALYSWHAIHFDKGLARAEQIYYDELMHTADAQEGVVAFMERRRPKWARK